MNMVGQGERRNDIGTKAILALYSTTVAILLGFFVNVAWSTAKEGNGKAEVAIKDTTDLKERVAKLEVYYLSYNDDLKEIKNLLKRQPPK